MDRKPNPDHVICPSCNHDFPAIPESAQAQLAAARGGDWIDRADKPSGPERHALVELRLHDGSTLRSAISQGDGTFMWNPWPEKVEFIPFQGWKSWRLA